MYRNSVVALVLVLVTQGGAAEMLAAAPEDLVLLYENEEVVSIATGTRKPIHLAPSVATVITAAQLRRSGARMLDDALEQVPGLHVSLSNLNRLNPVYSIRGIHTGANPHVLLLIDGVVINNAVNGSRPNLLRLPVSNIARIEVVRGPGSAIFGADAFAGVINVITKEGRDIDGIEVGGRAGSFDTQDAWLLSGQRYRDWDIALSLEYNGSAGDRKRVVSNDLQTGFDALFGTNASLAPGSLETGYKQVTSSLSATGAHWSLRFHALNLRDGGVGAGAGQVLDPVGKQQQDHYLVAVEYNDFKPALGWRLDARFNYRALKDRVTFQLFPPGARLPIGADGNLFTSPGCTAPSSHPVFGDVCLVDFPQGVLGNPGATKGASGLDVIAYYDGFDRHRLRLAVGGEHLQMRANATQNFGPGVIDGSVSPIGAGLVDTTGTAGTFLPDKSRGNHFFSLQDEWQLVPDWELTAGVRHDNYTDFGSTTNPRVALVWATDYHLTSKLLYGRAFRAPSFAELYFQNNPVTTGNPGLLPETIDMTELVFDYRPTFNVEAVLSIFHYVADDLIEYVGGVAQNVGEQQGRGFELDLGWRASDRLKLNASYALQLAQDTTTSTDVADAPQRHLYLSTIWDVNGRWQLGGSLNWLADRPRASGDSRPAVGNYSIVNATLRYRQASVPWELALMARNVFDADAVEPSGGQIADDYPLEGRAFYLEGRYRY